jgi:hypothetical protein
VALAVQATGGHAARATEGNARSQPRLLLMFTWEEAGLLRQMLMIILWVLVAVIMVVGIWVATT